MRGGELPGEMRRRLKSPLRARRGSPRNSPARVDEDPARRVPSGRGLRGGVPACGPAERRDLGRQCAPQHRDAPPHPTARPPDRPTTRLATDALVIGGGMTGAGVLRDLALRGIRAVLVERGDAASGTTGRYHGLLHSGGRYAVKDPVSARDCARENAILRRIIPQCIEDTGGYFVVTPWDPPDYADRFVAACRAQGVPCEEVPVREALRREPRLNPRIARAFAVPDAAADSFLSVATNLRSAREHGAEVLTYHRVASLIMEGPRVVGAWVVDRRTGEERAIEAGVVVNAAGAWAGQIGALAGVDITIVPGRGVMVALNHRLVNTVLNRCQPPADGDILVPIRTVCVIGTTDRHVADPDDTTMPADEVAFMLAEGDKLVPGLATSRALRAWAGSRPLYKETGSTVADRDLSRDYTLLDHEERDGVAGFISIVGGKYTTYRLMAERTVDLAARRLGRPADAREEGPRASLPRSYAPRSTLHAPRLRRLVRRAAGGGDAEAP
ncbi:MAG TPA: anaerobic glycerol-3-phosphate dehydrogenase subunit A, partial [Thermomicrobiales bacterium]|nr:anaerobic glycerol-3-phosphate dehydrogenase subunit A [Thermomicrobiales bacterium]